MSHKLKIQMILIVMTAATFSGCAVGRGSSDSSQIAMQAQSQEPSNAGNANQDNKAIEEKEIRYTRELVSKKVKDTFPKESLSEIMGILDQYGVESYERERERVQIAILKLSEGKLKELRDYVKAAKQDYRDVLAYAEYPLEMQSEPGKLDARQAAEVRAKDRKQYLDWLNNKETDKPLPDKSSEPKPR